ncbi:hypothetical protein ACWDN6_14470 [Streptomyces albogriseolus]
MLPEGIPTVTVTGRFLRPDGNPLSGQVVFRAPALLTFSDYDVIVGGPVTAPLDAQGAFTVELPATDAPGMNPSGWTYSVAEQFTGVAQNRVYQILLPAATPAVDLADIAPTDPSTPTYVPVVGPEGPPGPPGEQGEPGPVGAEGPAGAPGVVQSVNGQSVAAVVLDADDVQAVPTAARGAADGVAALGPDSKVPGPQLPYYGWRPDDLGFKAWAFDPAASQSGGRAPSNRSFRIVGIPVREQVTVSSIALHVMGYTGTGLDPGSFAGVFTSAGVRVAQTADMADTAVIPVVSAPGGRAVTCPLTAPVVLDPGIYYVGFYFVIGTAANAPQLMVADSAAACPVTSLNTIHPFGNISGLPEFPALFTEGTIEFDPIRFWSALA